MGIPPEFEGRYRQKRGETKRVEKPLSFRSLGKPQKIFKKKKIFFFKMGYLKIFFLKKVFFLKKEKGNIFLGGLGFDNFLGNCPIFFFGKKFLIVNLGLKFFLLKKKGVLNFK